jgi:Protein of unknown function (DUF1592)/Protein of unknown function (DUF1588)/Protein of unknown function (DUF1595)/Protein of unknown function (DUF1585)
VAPVELENYQTAAELVAASVVANDDKLQAWVPCATKTAPRDCARTFITKFGTRIYRSLLTAADDIDRHLAVYDLGAKTSHAHGIELVLQAMLQAPRFLYRVELGTDSVVGTTAVALSGYELATRLSYALWDSAPDDVLLQAAENGALATPEGRKTVLKTMLDDARGQRALQRFLERWLHLPQLSDVVKDATLFPEWNGSPLRAALQTQAERFLDDTVGRQGGHLRALLTSSTVFVNADLTSYYGVKDTGDWHALELTDGKASGVLTLPAWLSMMAKPAESSPIYRGKFVREALLCQILPAPPANIPKPPEVTKAVSTRQRLAQHETDAACSGCHRLMDPIGFGFENYDAIGRYRDKDADLTIDDRGELLSTQQLDGEFHGVRELGDKLADSAEVQECMVRQWFRFALGRFEQSVDDCSIARLTQAFMAADADLHTLPAALIESDAFLYRQREAAP